MRKSIFVLIMFGFVFTGMAGDAQASPFVTICPDTPVEEGLDREFQITIDATQAATCLKSGLGNLSGNGDTINQLNGGYYWETLDKSDDLNPGGEYDPPAFLTFTGSNTLGGTFSFDESLWDTYERIVIAFKSGEGVLDPEWAAFELPFGISEGDWAILTGQQSLSHANLYGYDGVVQTAPEPASLALLGLGLAAGARRLRRKN